MVLQPIHADNLTTGRHGFFTRIGGVSTGIYAGLNCGLGSDDDKDSVRKNRLLAAKMFGLDNNNLVSVHQVHSADATVVTGPWAGDPPKCDAMVTSTPGVALGILTADCAPVLFEDRSAGVVAAAHSGWRGAVSGILEATLDKMVTLGAQRDGIAACVGPCISQRAYEVGPEFVEEFADTDPAFTQYFAQGEGDRALFDLPRFVMDRLRAAGVAEAAWTGHCTYSDPQRFFSYRRSCHNSEPDYGRLISVIAV